MEYCAEGTLERICREVMDMTLVRMYTNSLLKAIAYIHKIQIVHRDIKPANIFLDLRSRLKLGDFGCSVRLREQDTVRGELAEYAGTPQYMVWEFDTPTSDIFRLLKFRLMVERWRMGGSEAMEELWTFGVLVVLSFTWSLGDFRGPSATASRSR